MIIDLQQQSPGQIYHSMTQTLIPRPVAWVLSQNPQGNYNMAPFSYFTAVSSDPPLIMISVGKKPDGSLKDTRANIIDRRLFTVHIGRSSQAGAMTETSRTLPHGESELDDTGLTTVPFPGFDLPRVAECPIAMACELYEVQEIGPRAQALIFGRVLQIHVDDSLARRDDDGRIHVDAAAVDPVARLGADEYGKLGEILNIPRPG